MYALNMAKLSSQLKAGASRLTRTQRVRQKVLAKPKPIPQAPLPEGSLVKADVEQRLQEEEAKVIQIQQERTEAYNKMTAGSRNVDPRDIRQFHHNWNIKTRRQEAKVRILRDLNAQMTTNSYIAEDKLSGTLGQASSQAQIDYERSEKADERRADAREQAKIVAEPTGVINAEDFLKDLEKGETREVKRAEGGLSEVTVYTDADGRKVQVVRSKDTGDIRIVELEGKNKGAVLIGKGLTDAEVQSTSKYNLKQEIAEGEKSKVDIEEVKVDTSKLGFWQKTAYNLRQLPKNIPIPIFAGTSGTLKLGDITGDPKLKQVISTGVTKTVGGIDRVLQSTLQLGVPVFTADAGSTTIFTVKEGKSDWVKGLQEEKLETYEEDVEARGLTETYKPKFEEEYKTEFLKKYGEQIITGDITQEKAEIDFAQSEEAKEVGRRYQEVIDIERGKEITGRSFKLYGLGIAEMGLKLIPETLGGLALETGVISGAVYLGGKIPTSVVNSAYGFGTVWGTATALDPTISPEKRVGGIVLAGTSATLLGISGVRYLRQPTIKTAKIEAPKVSVKADSIIAKDGKIYQVTKGGETKLFSQTKFGYQKIQQIGISGRRTIISTRWRDLLKFDPIYRGVPTAQRGTTYALQGFRGTYTYTTPSGYQKALDLLMKRMRLSESTARGVLRYTAPKVIDVTLEKGILNVVGDKAIGQFRYRIDQPVIDVDDLLGIKTRGARSIRNIYDINRYKDLQGNIVTNVKETTTFVTKEGASYNTLTQAGKTTTLSTERSLVKVGEIENSFNKLAVRVGGDVKYFEISKKVPYQYQDLTSKYVKQQTIPFENRYEFGKGKTTIIKAKEGQEAININLDEYNKLFFPKRSGTLGGTAEQEIERILKRQGIKDAIITQTKTKPFTFEYVDDAVRDIVKTKPTTTKPFTFEYVDDAVSSSGSQQLVQESKFAGQGTYERTETVKDIILEKPNQLLQGAFDPTIDIKSQIKSLIKLDTITKPSLNLGLASLGALETSQFFKEDLKSDLKLGSGLKLDIKTNQQIKQLIKQAQPQAQKSTQALKLSQVLDLAPVSTISPVFKTPTFPTFKPPVTPPITIPFWFPSAKSKVKKKLDSKFGFEKAYLPDFTARSLGLEPEALTLKQAQKRIKKTQTGLEIRRGIKLLKGIPE